MQTQWIEKENGDLINLGYVQKIAVTGEDENWIIALDNSILKRFKSQDEAEEILKAIKKRITEGATIVTAGPEVSRFKNQEVVE